MAETKKQLFEELQVKEAEAERCKKAAAELETQLEEQCSQWQEQLQNQQQELEEKEAIIKVFFHQFLDSYVTEPNPIYNLVCYMYPLDLHLHVLQIQCQLYMFMPHRCL